jgi:tRNA (mo5U34)-methyltransferase
VSDARGAVAAQPHWYHTMELAPGVVTPGWFDLRPILDRLPWPDVNGRRCLDVGTYDGHLAFELERRGAAEVVATDLSDHAEWDWPARLRARGPEALAAIAGAAKGRGFDIARELLGSRVRREQISVYELSAERLGEFDVVVCGSLLLHLREPLRALSAIRSVCRRHLLSAETIDVSLPRRDPVARLDGLSELCQWWTPNRAGHRRMVEAAGFDIERDAGAYCVRLGPAHPRPPRTLRRLAQEARMRLATRQVGVPHAAVLARAVA